MRFNNLQGLTHLVRQLIVRINNLEEGTKMLLNNYLERLEMFQGTEIGHTYYGIVDGEPYEWTEQSNTELEEEIQRIEILLKKLP